MNTDSTSFSPDDPVFEGEMDATYTLDVIAELAGVNTQTVVHYHRQGFISTTTTTPEDDGLFDTECLRRIRRIEYLKNTCEVNERGIKLFLSLLDEIDHLRQQQHRPEQ